MLGTTKRSIEKTTVRPHHIVHLGPFISLRRNTDSYSFDPTLTWHTHNHDMHGISPKPFLKTKSTQVVPSGQSIRFPKRAQFKGIPYEKKITIANITRNSDEQETADLKSEHSKEERLGRQPF